jgi:hypothetical protein
MTSEQVKSIRRLTGRCEANIEELVNLLSKSTDNYALRCAAWADLAALLLSDIEACQAQQQAAVEAARVEAKAEGVMEERHKCLADMCWMCEKNYPVHKVIVDNKVIWMHPRTRGGRYGAPCPANPIRLRWAKE